MKLTDEEIRENLKSDAEREIVQYKALKILLTNNDLAAHIECCGLSLGMVNNTTLIPAVDHCIKEIEKSLNGEDNEWE